MCNCNKGKTAGATPYTVTWAAATPDGDPEVVEYSSRPAAVVAMAGRPGGRLKAGAAPATA